MIPDIPIIDVRTCGMRMSEVLDGIERMQQAHGEDFEIFLDGDAYAIVARLREAVA